MDDYINDILYEFDNFLENTFSPNATINRNRRTTGCPPVPPRNVIATPARSSNCTPNLSFSDMFTIERPAQERHHREVFATIPVKFDRNSYPSCKPSLSKQRVVERPEQDEKPDKLEKAFEKLEFYPQQQCNDFAYKSADRSSAATAPLIGQGGGVHHRPPHNSLFGRPPLPPPPTPPRHCVPCGRPSSNNDTLRSSSSSSSGAAKRRSDGDDLHRLLTHHSARIAAGLT